MIDIIYETFISFLLNKRIKYLGKMKRNLIY